MKIAVVGTRGFPDVQGGVESHCEHLYTQLAHKGGEITVYTRKPYVDSEIDNYKGVSLVSVGCPKNKFLEAIVHTFKAILKARKLRPDILHIHAVGPSFFAPLARILGMKVVVTSHGPDYERKKWSAPAKIFLKFCERMGMTYANKIIAIANNISDDIKKKYGKDAVVIPNGVEIPQRRDTDVTLKMYGLQKKKYILAVGRLVPEKGFHDLIEAFNLGDFGDYKLVIVGSADHEDRYSHSIKNKAGDNNQVVLTGFLTGLPIQELYSHARLFVLPSYYEGLPIALLEAMSYGLSCIVSDIPANRNIELSENRFFEPGNVKLLNVKLKEFIADLWKEEDRDNQILMIKERYKWSKIADETIKIYECLMSN